MDGFSPYGCDDTSEALQALRDVALSVETPHEWPVHSALEAAFDHVEHNLSHDLDALRGDMRDLIEPQGNMSELGDDIAGLLRRWSVTGSAPSLLAMCVFALGEMRIDLSPDLMNGVMVSAVLGEVENDQPYHDNMHYKKVLLQAIRLIAVHNDIYDGAKRSFNMAQIATLLMAACIHDIGHDGLGNFVKGVHIEGRLEKLSFEYAKPYLMAVGCTDEKILNDLYVMLLTTDVSPLDDPGNPMHQMKAAYRFHFLGEKSRTHSLNLGGDLAVLEKDSALAMQCLILHEADIATSAGLNYAVTQYETAILREEFCEDEGQPSHVIDFLNQICDRRFLSDAGQKLYAANLARIYARAEEDLQNGDQPYPKAQHTDFILGAQGRMGGESTVLN